MVSLAISAAVQRREPMATAVRGDPPGPIAPEVRDEVTLRTETSDARSGGARGELRRLELLVGFDGAHPTRTPPSLSLRGVQRVVIGRGDGHHVDQRQRGAHWELVVELDDTQVSREHAILERTRRDWKVTDGGSRNGTRLDGRRLAARVAEALEPGARLQIGRTLLVFRDVAATAPPEPGSLVAGFRTQSAELGAALAVLSRVVANAGVSTLVRGPTGSGKEVVARGIHALLAARGRAGRFVAVNSAALPATLVEAELFGARRGSFTGAVEDRDGLVRAADGGTLFLDEIGDLAPLSQAALLRVLQEREVRAVGATQTVPIDVFVVSATHRDLDAMMERGEFRRDLYARLAGHELWLPPLAERIEDLGVLAAPLLMRAAPHATFSADAVAALAGHRWPLNVRELEGAIARALALADDGRVELEHLPPACRLGPHRPAAHPADGSAVRRSGPDDEALAELRAQLTQHGGNVSEVARAMGKHRRQIQRWLERSGLDAAAFRRR